jgi:hypothetical protein
VSHPSDLSSGSPGPNPDREEKISGPLSGPPGVAPARYRRGDRVYIADRQVFAVVVEDFGNESVLVHLDSAAEGVNDRIARCLLIPAADAPSGDGSAPVGGGSGHPDGGGHWLLADEIAGIALPVTLLGVDGDRAKVGTADGVIEVESGLVFDHKYYSLGGGFGLYQDHQDGDKWVRQRSRERRSNWEVRLRKGRRARSHMPGPVVTFTVLKASDKKDKRVWARRDGDGQESDYLKETLVELDGAPLKDDRERGGGRARDGARSEDGQARPAAEGPEGRPQIEILDSERHRAHEEVARTLAADPDLYRRGDALGVVIEEEDDEAKFPGGVAFRKARGSARFHRLGNAALGCVLCRNADFYKMKKGKGGEEFPVACGPPDWLIAAIAETPTWPGVRELLTIAECPAVRADGSLTDTGYDPATGCLFRTSVPIPPIPDRPTKADAEEAAGRLFAVVRQFPFEDVLARAVWLAAVLTGVQRPVIAGPVPGFVINGNKAGTGKGLLIDMAGIVVWGHVIPTRTYCKDDEEAGKVKLTLALGAAEVVHFDNVAEGAYYGGSSLDSALTTTVADGRILGVSRDAGPVPLRPCWFLSGNNVSPYRDAYRRWIPCNLITQEEHPHERDDIEIRNMRAHILARRGELLRDALIILTAHALAGRPSEDGARLGSFEEWDEVVRGAVWFATGLDCLVPQREAAGRTYDRAKDLALLAGWRELDPEGKGKTVNEAIQVARTEAANTGAAKYPQLREAVYEFLGQDGQPDPKKISYRLRAIKMKVLEGYRFEERGEDHFHRKLWAVKGVIQWPEFTDSDLEAMVP